MGKHSAYKEIETALVNAIWMDNEAPVLSPLNQINEALLINLEVQNQLGYLHRLTSLWKPISVTTKGEPSKSKRRMDL